MRQAEVIVGQVYLANVSGEKVPVRLDQTSPYGGWDATNLKTNRKIRIRSAQRLHGKASSRCFDCDSCKAMLEARVVLSKAHSAGETTLEEAKEALALFKDIHPCKQPRF